MGGRVFAIWLVAAVTMVTGYVVFGLLHDRIVASRRRRFEASEDDLAVILTGDDAAAAASFDTVVRLPRAVLVDAVQRLAADLDGQGLERLRHLAEGVGIVGRIHRLARSWRWRRRVMAAQLLHLLPEGDACRAEL
ncbi:MAG: hypothetical protein KDB21_14370, partial [Acidimicrobiales bacterium]|nr:hypothetical protein [Acidimicrobiales bacterium]